MTKNNLTIIINTFNSNEKIFSCINSIDNNIKIIIIENSNNFEFKNSLEKKYENIECFLAKDNLGYAKGNNLGLSMVKTKYALVLNPDTILEKNAIGNFFLNVKKSLDFAIIGPAIQEKKDNLKQELKFKDDLIEVEYVKGFAMFLNLDQFKEVGFFDENFFIYLEEIDLCKRLKKAGKKIFLDKNIIIEHLGASSHNKSLDFQMDLSRNWHWMWSTFYFKKKYKGFVLALFEVLPKLISSLIKFTIFFILNKNDKKKIYFQRFSGLVNSIMGKSSWYRPKL